MALKRLVDPKAADVGMPVLRLLPRMGQRSVGPFVFLDHFGPQVPPAGKGDILSHPHIGIATVTFLFSGEMLHKDSLGSVQAITPGAINWMSAGRGIVHAERLSEQVRSKGEAMHGLQLWVALPKSHEEGDPGFWHHPAASLPTVEGEGISARVMVGEAFGKTSPVKTPMQTIYVAAELKAGATFTVTSREAERAVYAVEGELEIDGQSVSTHQLAVLEQGESKVRALGPAKLVVLGGEPLDGPRHMWWNFVSSDPKRLDAARDTWRAGGFVIPPGETERVPAPEL
jgi:redox-sensitive bicupin YhaK (pirin superfamily)